MRRYNKYLVLFLIAILVNGCVKFDNPLPDIRNTTWKRTYNDNWQRISFSGSKVHCETYTKDLSDTVFSYSDYCAFYVGGEDGNRRFYSWIDETENIEYKVYSFGSDNIVIEGTFSGEGRAAFFYKKELFYRGEDPINGYNF